MKGGQYPLADIDRGGQYPLADFVRGVKIGGGVKIRCDTGAKFGSREYLTSSLPLIRYGGLTSHLKA